MTLTSQRRYEHDIRRLLMREGLPMDPAYSGRNSCEGWTDHDAVPHIRSYGDGCEWILPDDAPVTERTYSVFDSTFDGSSDEAGIESGPARCACGRYTDVTLRYVGTLDDVVSKLGLHAGPTVVVAFPRADAGPTHRIDNPVRRGQTITLPRGVAYRHRGQVRHTQRSQQITAAAVSDGWVNSTEASEGLGFVHLPKITWAGSGGYWSDVKLTPELADAIGVDRPVIDPRWGESNHYYRLDVLPDFGAGYDDRDD